MTICALALVIEALIGYPAPLYRFAGHPVTWIGRTLASLDRRLNREDEPRRTRRRKGTAATVALLGLCILPAAAIQSLAFAILPPAAAVIVVAIFASTLLAQRSLDSHARAVADALRRDGLDAGRRAVAMIVGRETSTLDEAGVTRAAIESLAENFADGVVAPALYIAVLGLPGGAAYKAINTADSMIGHRTPRHEAFGFAAAKLDDLVNWPAARLSALWIVLAAAILPGASGRDAWRIMRRDSTGHPSPNAGWPEAAMAGALGIRLGGPRTYVGKTVADRTIGDGTAAVDAGAIAKALRLYRLACGLNILAIALAPVVTARWL